MGQNRSICGELAPLLDVSILIMALTAYIVIVQL